MQPGREGIFNIFLFSVEEGKKSVNSSSTFHAVEGFRRQTSRTEGLVWKIELGVAQAQIVSMAP
jgi:hypothetical protein